MKYLIACFMLLSLLDLAGQDPEISLSNAGIRSVNGFDSGMGSTDVLGSTFLSDDWSEFEIKLKHSDKTNAYEAKINLLSGLIHMQIGGQEVTAESSRIEYLKELNSGRVFVYLGEIQSLVEVVYSNGDKKVFKRYSLKMQSGGYNPVLDAGQKESSWKRKIMYFVAVNENMLEVKRSKGLYKFLIEQGYLVQKNEMPSKLDQDGLISLISSL